MSKKAFIASASGLRNIVFINKIEDDNFKFIVAEKEIQVRRILADFISPLASHIHHSDPTIDSLCLNDAIPARITQQISELCSPELIDNIQKIANGYSIDIDECMCDKLRTFSILLGNSDIFNQLNELYPIKSDIDGILQHIQYFNSTKSSCMFYENSQIYDILSLHFHSIDESKLLNLSKPIIYGIISNQNLKVASEDSLFDFINKYFSQLQNDEDNLNIISFYELLDIANLSEGKFKEFIEMINPNDISRLLWEKMKECITNKKSANSCSSRVFKPKEEDGKVINVPFNGNQSNRFSGIINMLGQGNPTSVVDKGIVDITSSSVVNNSECCQPRCAIEYNADHSGRWFYSTDDKSDSSPWLCFDFKKQKVRPSHYSLRSIARHKGDFNLMNWDIEGSNDGRNWKVLDSRRNETSLDDYDASNTFEIQNRLSEDEYYRYLRIHKKGPNANNTHQLMVSSLEYFGIIKKE